MRASKLILALLALASLAAPVAPPPAQALELAAGVPPVAWLVGRVAGPEATVQILSGPGQNPHTFEPTPKQVAGLSRAAAYFSVGLPFEEKVLAKLKAANPGLRVVDLTAGLDLLPEPAEPGHGHGPGKAAKGHGHAKPQAGGHAHDEGEMDPHVWLSPRLCQAMARAVATGLSELDPARAPAYAANLAGLLADLQGVDARLGGLLAPLKGQEFLVYHPAFGYFGRDYGLRQVAVETGGREPGPKRLAGLIARAKARKIKVIFVQPQFPQKTAEQVAREIGGAVAALDDLAADPLANWERMAQALTQGLAGAGRP
ncbi:MAG: metal ABC transporter solute-binding protein, Zn/Mn family [Thermodesulfobacteriota bacterium]